MNKAKKEALTKLKAPFDVIKRSEKPSFGCRKEHSRRKHQEDFGRVLGNQIPHMYQVSFGK